MTRRIILNGTTMDDRRTNPLPTAVEGWHLEKRFPISLIVFLLFQTAGFIWWASEVNSMVKDHERRLIIAEAFQSRTDGDGKTNGERLARLEATAQSNAQVVSHIENILERQEERFHSDYRPQHR